MIEIVCGLLVASAAGILVAANLEAQARGHAALDRKIMELQEKRTGKCRS